MILLQKDWQRPEYKNSIVHFNTKNESFLKVAYTLKLMGVKHWYMHLALINPELEFVNIHDKDLDRNMKAKILKEFFINPWFAFRECLQIPQDGAGPVLFKLHRGSFTLIWCFFMNIDIALLLIRQQGKTVVIAALLVYTTRILKGSRTILITKDSGLRSETITKMKKIRDTLPKWMWQHSRRDADNSEVFTYVSRDNKVLTAIAQSSVAGAENAGRGITAARLIADEVAFIRYVQKMLPAALASGTTARRIAEEEGIPYCNVFTTTPGKRDSAEGAYVYDLFHDGLLWDEHYLDIPTRSELISMMYRTMKGKRLLIHAPFNHRQLGMTDMELFKAKENAGGTREEQLRDFGLQWTAGGLSSPLTVDEANMVRDSVHDDTKYTEIFPNGYVIKWHYDAVELKDIMNKPHIIGVDTSDAVGRDNISLVFVNSETLGVSGTAIVNESNLVVFANWLGDILIKYPKTVAVIERKSSAPTIIDALLLKLPAAGIEPTRRLYNTIAQNRPHDDKAWIDFSSSNRPRDAGFYEHYRKYVGYVTTGEARRQLYGDVLQTAVRMAGNKIRDKQLAGELLALVVKNGRIDHSASGHDDTVIAWLLACWFMLNGNRLDYYGVSNRILMRRNNRTTDIEFDEEEYQEKLEEQESLQDEIDELCTRISTCKNPFLAPKLERQLRVALGKLDLDTGNASTVGELQEIIRNEKLKTRYGK